MRISKKVTKLRLKEILFQRSPGKVAVIELLLCSDMADDDRGQKHLCLAAHFEDPLKKLSSGGIFEKALYLLQMHSLCSTLQLRRAQEMCLIPLISGHY